MTLLISSPAQASAYLSIERKKMFELIIRIQSINQSIVDIFPFHVYIKFVIHVLHFLALDNTRRRKNINENFTSFFIGSNKKKFFVIFPKQQSMETRYNVMRGVNTKTLIYFSFRITSKNFASSSFKCEKKSRHQIQII